PVEEPAAIPFFRAPAEARLRHAVGDMGAGGVDVGEETPAPRRRDDRLDALLRDHPVVELGASGAGHQVLGVVDVLEAGAGERAGARPSDSMVTSRTLAPARAPWRSLGGGGAGCGKTRWACSGRGTKPAASGSARGHRKVRSIGASARPPKQAGRRTAEAAAR